MRVRWKPSETWRKVARTISTRPASSMAEQSPFKRLVTGSSPVRVTLRQAQCLQY